MRHAPPSARGTARALRTCALAVLLCAAGCAGGKQAGEQTLRTYERGFDPAKYRTPLAEPSAAAVDTVTNARPATDAGPKQAAVPKTPAEPKTGETTVMGYRVQLSSTTSLDEATVQREDLRLRIAQNAIDAGDVDMTFDAPYYKLRVGSFTTKAEADALRRTLIDAGFPEAWVVRDRIKASGH